MNDTDHIDELIEEMKEYNEMIDNNKNRDQEIVEYEEAVNEEDLEKTKQNIIEYEEKVSDEDLGKTKVITGNVTEDMIDTTNSESNNESNNEEEEKKEDKKFNRTVIITIVCVCVVGILVLIFLIVLSKHRSKTVSIKDDDIISKSEYKEIIKEYGDLLTDNVKEYMLAYNNQVPTFEEASNKTNYKHKVVCTKNNVNYDGSIYLDDCLIDNYTNKYKYTYGKYLEEIKEDTSNNKKIYIYKNNRDKEYNYYALNNTIDIENIELVDTYTCSSDECKGYNTSTKNNKDVVLYDNAYYLYNPISKSKNEITGLSTDTYMFIDLMTRSDGSSYALYLTKSNGYGAFYRVDKKVLVTDYLYSSNTTTEKLLEAGYFGGVKESKNSSVSIIHQNTGEEVYTFKDALYISDTKINGVNYYYLGGSLFGEKNGYFITNTFTKIVPNKDSYNYSINSDNTLTIKNNNTFEVYDFTGNKIYTSSSYSSVLKLLKDYVIVSTDKEVKILDNKGKVITKFFDTKNSYEYHTTLTDSDHSNGIISMIVLDKSVNDGVEGRGVEFTYNINTKEIKINKMTTVGGHD